MEQIILTGDRPTGRLHVGHYVGSLKRRVELQNSGKYDKIFIMIADAQALTDNAEHPEKVRQNIIEVALDYLACGLDPVKSTMFIQSQIQRDNGYKNYLYCSSPDHPFRNIVFDNFVFNGTKLTAQNWEQLMNMQTQFIETPTFK